jgi:pimeloyl-ACP methyl ester carboxylesterase
MRTITSRDGTRIAFDQSGQGPALVLVGGASETRANETQLAATLSPYFTVFAYDRRARGDSGDTRPYAVEREVDDIEALIDEAGESAFVFGESSVAVLALYEPPFIIDETHAPLPDGFAMEDTQKVSPESLKKWASVTIPTLVMDGSVLMGSEEAHTFMRHGADALASVMPNAQQLTLEGQDHGPSDEALVPALRTFFLG